MTKCAYIDDQGRTVFLSQGISQDMWGAFYKKPNGSLKKVRAIPMVSCRHEAAQILTAYAEKKGWLPEA